MRKNPHERNTCRGKERFNCAVYHSQYCQRLHYKGIVPYCWILITLFKKSCKLFSLCCLCSTQKRAALELSEFYVCLCTNIYTHLYTCSYLHAYTYMHIYTYILMHTNIHPYTHIFIHKYSYTCAMHIYTHMACTYIYACLYVCVYYICAYYIYTYVYYICAYYIYTYIIHTNTHTYISPHIHTLTLWNHSHVHIYYVTLGPDYSLQFFLFSILGTVSPEFILQHTGLRTQLCIHAVHLLHHCILTAHAWIVQHHMSSVFYFSISEDEVIRLHLSY